MLIGKIFKRPTGTTAFIEDREEKSKCIIDETLSKDITAITGQPSWCTQFLDKVLDETNKENIHEVRPNFEVFFGG
jgi:hypothetical protein